MGVLAFRTKDGYLIARPGLNSVAFTIADTDMGVCAETTIYIKEFWKIVSEVVRIQLEMSGIALESQYGGELREIDSKLKKLAEIAEELAGEVSHDECDE